MRVGEIFFRSSCKMFLSPLGPNLVEWWPHTQFVLVEMDLWIQPTQLDPLPIRATGSKHLSSHHNCSRHPDLPDQTVAVGGHHRPLRLAEVSEGHRHRAGTWGLHWVLETAESLELSLSNGIFPTKLFWEVSGQTVKHVLLSVFSSGIGQTRDDLAKWNLDWRWFHQGRLKSDFSSGL